MSRSDSAFHAAVGYLRAGLSSRTWRIGNRLPPLASLASTAGVSRGVMGRAVRALAEEGALDVVRRGSITVSAPSGAAAGRAREATKTWQRKKALLHRDILTGRAFPGGELPSLKELQHRYGVCFVTLRKMLGALVDDGLIEPYRRSYRVRGFSGGRYRRSVVLIAGGPAVDTIHAGDRRTLELIKALENACTQQNLTVVKVGFAVNDPEILIKIRRAVAGVHDPAGFILHMWWPSVDTLRRRYGDLLHYLCSVGLPIAVIDESCTFELPRELSGRAPAQVLRIASRLAGRAAARRLLELGHRSMAFISGRHANVWSVGRLEGIAAECAEAGVSRELDIVVEEAVLDTTQHLLSVLEMDEDAFVRMLRPRYSPGEVDDLLRNYRALRGKRLAGPVDPAAVRTINEGLGALAPLAQKNVEREFYAEAHRAVWDRARFRAQEMYLGPLFERALARRSTTAWIAANDRTALAALKWLRSRGHAVPGSLSVVGFDNLPEAFNGRLSSYDFNISGIAGQALMFILAPPRRPMHFTPEAVEVEGFLIERESTGQAPKA